jgi:hypothetical protein
VGCEGLVAIAVPSAVARPVAGGFAVDPPVAID